jgi:uncharacterized membrane protein YfcA
VGITEAIFLAAAGFGAGAINGAAGGGSLISFPALVAAGHPTVVANVTSTVGIWPGYVGGSAAYRSAIGSQRRRLIRLLPPVITGSVSGVVLLLSTSENLFASVAPWLILAAVGLFTLQPLVVAKVRRPSPATERGGLLLMIGTFLASAYGSYFGAGLGVMLLALLGSVVPDDLQHLNGLRGAMALVINSIALVLYAIIAPVAWSAVAVLSIASLVGGFTGARAAQRLRPAWFRAVVIVFGLVAAVRLLIG